MSYAIANKKQMRIWKAAATLLKGDPERQTNRVMLTVKNVDGLQMAYLVASDGYQLMKRNIPLDDEVEFKEYFTAIPRKTVEKAEKAMKDGDRAYFDENKITVKEAIKNEAGDITDYKVVAVMPYIEQVDMLSEFETVLESSIKDKEATKVVTFDAKLLQLIADQMKDENGIGVHLTVTFRGELDVITFAAFEDQEDMEITGAIMPMKG